MSYTKTNWVNNTTPINETNLNKIEQGIYDNSLVVDAVTNTLNPTDTETYKTAELTEGQITDVIGVSDILIKGQTSQNGEPTPSSPVDINVVSGSNVINTRDRNQFKSNVERKQGYPGVSSDAIGSKVVYYSSGATYSYIRCAYLQSGKNYTISWTQSKTPASKNARIGVLIDKNDIALEAISTWINSQNSITISANNNGYLVLATDINATNIQIEEGSTATTYTNQGKELPLDLPVENLAELENGSLWDNNGTERDLDNSVRTKFISFESSMTILPKIFTSLNTRYLQYILYDSNKSFISLNNFTDATAITTSDTNVKYIRFKMTGPVSGTMTINDINFMVVKGNTIPNAYTPYGTTPIELCKIGDYQDYFYKSGSKWYLHKEIEKVALDGSESWGKVESDRNTRFLIPENLRTLVRGNTITYCNYFIGKAGTNYLFVDGCVSNPSSGTISFYKEDIKTINDWTTYLNLNNVVLYYVLATATDTEITDTTLISQLEAIYNAPLYEQTNITQANNDLPMILDITACKDNINGIKAFIRK